MAKKDSGMCSQLGLSLGGLHYDINCFMGTPKPRFAAVLFDMDGTICNTEEIYQQAWVETLDFFGHPPDPLLIESLRGLHSEACLPALSRFYGKAFDCERFLAHKRARSRELCQTNLSLCAGIESTISSLAENCIPMALVTSAPKIAVQANARRFEALFALFNTIVSLDDVDTPKPDPASYLLAARQLSVPPSNCLGVEDSIVGARSAIAAGCEVALVTKNAIPADIRPRGRVHVVPDARHVLGLVGLA